MFRVLVILSAVAAGGLLATAHAQSGGTVERIKVHSPSVEGNLQGNPADRDVVVYLPPSYESDPDRRYPVVYQLHGWLPSAEMWSNMISLEQGADNSIANGTAREMIVVLPDALTIFEGSMYSTSVTTGDFEGFIVRDLVAYIDSHYRTMAERASRGLSGHSMGGYGTLRLAMKYPELYSSFYAMSSCCLTPYVVDDAGNRAAAAITTLEEAEAAPVFTKVPLSLAAAWSPNPQKPPLYFDFPLADGEVQPLVIAKWNANVPLAMIDQYIPNLRRYDAIGLEIGLEDGLIDGNRQLSRALTDYGIDHGFETYEGDHTNRVAERFEQAVMPFFSEHLDVE
ncbi:MAG TPA: alpha/beta hydrolase-fold protein [Gammaproteobacteria bacterium]|nr:alpha/beta hydrolase-fold protein [Gammaproteobacteria bacterium]